MHRSGLGRLLVSVLIAFNMAAGAFATAFSLAGKTAIVTGGSGAIGKAISRALAGSGATVVITGRRADALQKVAELVSEEVRLTCEGKGGVVVPITSDVTDEASVRGLFDEVASSHGPCDLLVNSAGIAKGGPLTETSVEDFSSVMNVNVVGPFICSKVAFTHMIPKGGGRIINVGSISSVSPRPNSAPYTTSKFAINGLTSSLALDGRKHNIAVGAIHPGNVISDLLSPEEIARRQVIESTIYFTGSMLLASSANSPSPRQ